MRLERPRAARYSFVAEVLLTDSSQVIKYLRYVAAMRRREKIEQGAIRLNAKRVRLGAASQTLPQNVIALMKLFNLTAEQAIEMKNTLAASQQQAKV